jgi:hypothetical protein
VTYACVIIYPLGTLSAYALTVTNTTVRIAHYALTSSTENATANASETHPATIDDWEIGGTLALPRGAGISQS